MVFHGLAIDAFVFDDNITGHRLLERSVLKDLRTGPPNLIHNVRRGVSQVLRLSNYDLLPFLILVLHRLEESVVLSCLVVGFNLIVGIPVQLRVWDGASCSETDLLLQGLLEQQLV